MNFLTLATIGHPLPQIRLPRSEWPAVGRSITAISPRRRSLEFRFSSAARWWPDVNWSPKLAVLRRKRLLALKRVLRRRLYAEQHGKPLDAFPARVRALRKRKRKADLLRARPLTRAAGNLFYEQIHSQSHRLHRLRRPDVTNLRRRHRYRL